MQGHDGAAPVSATVRAIGLIAIAALAVACFLVLRPFLSALL